MREPPVPDNERERLESLESLNILDTRAEDRFDRLTRLARRLFDVPIALVTLVDEHRQWFKSCIGLELAETGRDVSFCGHAINNDRVLVVPDASIDERFRDNPLVQDEPRIRFYAGCPVRAPDGHRLGTVCIIDNRPRMLVDEDVQSLRDLASIAEDEIAILELAVTDDLTGLLNRRGFLMNAEQSLSLCLRKNLPAALVFIDVNGLKRINDTFGHREGDRAIRLLGEAAAGTCRDSDIVARLGGDEFVVLLTGADRDEASQIMSRMKTSLVTRHAEAQLPFTPSISYGIIAFDPQRHESVEKLLHEADARMYEYKRARQG